MFRNFDNWDRYLDNSGNPLRGCVQFMLRDGSTSANIFDSDYTPIANPQLTDVYGRTGIQVFLNSDVVAYFYKYIGERFADEEEGDIDTSDVTKWDLQFTVESLSIDERSVSGESAMAVADMDELRSLPVDEVPEIDGRKIICLQGYYELGDCEPVWYVWDTESIANDDNGGIIKSDEKLTGRWLLVQPTEHCDSRHFGVFPQDSSDAEIDQQVRITQLVNYCNAHSVRPYFNGSVSYPYFIYDAIRVSSRNPIDVSEDTVFVDKGDSAFGGEWNGNPLFMNHQTTVSCKTVRLSWQAKAYPNCIKFIIDTNYPVVLYDKIVVMEVNPNGSTQLTRCQVESNRMISGNITMSEMELHEDWFVDGYDWSKLNSYNNVINLDNFKSANTYITLKNKQHEADYGDLGEQTVSNMTLLANAIAENAAFSNVTITGNTELHNVSGTALLNGAAYNLNFVDCWLTFTNTANIVMDNIAWLRGSIGSSVRIQPLTSLLLDNVDVNAPIYSIGVEAKLYGCSINVPQYFFRDVQVIDCRVFTALNQYPQYKMPSHGYDGYYWCGMYSGNTFIGENAKIVLAPMPGVDYSELHMGLETKICNNVSDHAFVDDSLWNGVTKGGWAATSDFRYEGNKGGCPVSQDEIVYTMPYNYTGWVDDETSYCANVPGTSDSTGCWIVRDGRSTPERDVSYDIYWVLNFKNVALPLTNLFRLPYLRGNQRLRVKAFVQVFLRPDNDASWPFYVNSFTVDTPMLDTSVTGNASSAYVNSIRPMKYHHAGIRYCDNDDIDDWRSSLTTALYNYRNNGNCFVGSVRYTFSFSDSFGKTTEPEV